MLTKAGLNPRSVMEGMSRGGVYVYRWAARHPDRIAAVYADAPVLDMKSWPGGKGNGVGSTEDWQRFKIAFGLIDDAAAMAFRGNPVDLVGKIVEGGYPMLHVVGDADTVVPITENTTVFAQRAHAAGGFIEVIHKPDVGHHPHSLQNPQPIVEFVLKAMCRKI